MSENCQVCGQQISDPKDVAEIERLTAENERLRSQLGHCPNTTDGHHDWMMYLVGPDGQRLGPGSSPVSHSASAVFCQNCGAAKLPVEANRVVLSDQQSESLKP